MRQCAGNNNRSRTHANGFKPRSLQTAIGKLNLALPQVRGCAEPFRTSLLESCSRTDRSLKAAIAEMYLQGVSTRRVSKVLDELCGLDITSTQVSRLTPDLDTDDGMLQAHVELVHRAGLRLPPHPTQHPPQSGWF